MTPEHLLIVIACLSMEQQPADAEGVLRDYTQAIAELRVRFQTVRGEGVFVQETSAGEPDEVKLPRQITFAQNAELWKMSTVGLNELTKKGPHEVVRVWNARSAFKFHHAQKGDAPVLEFFMPRREDSDINETYRNYVGGCLAAPYSTGGYAMDSIIADDTFKLEGIHNLNRGSKRFFQLQFTHAFDAPTGSGRFIRRVSALVCPEDNWAIHEWSMNQRHVEWTEGRDFTGHVEYGPRQAGFPTLRHVTVLEGTKTSLGARQTRKYMDFQNFRFESVPEKEFSLSFFGLPELDRPAVKSQSHVAFWIFGIAAALLLVAIVLKRYSARIA